MKIVNYYSPNIDKKNRSKKSIKFIIIHYTGMQSMRESLIRLCNSKSKVSCHFLIGKNGKIYRLARENNIAWHAGKSCWKGSKNLNKNSIGIELVNKGHEFGYENFNSKQLYSLIYLCKNLVKKYNINKKNIIGHSDIAPNRKKDPGEKFPWKKLADSGVGIWHYTKSDLLIKNRKIKIYNKDKKKFIKNLKKIGYCYLANKKNISIEVVKAFQRHYRKQLINGIMDKESLIISENLLNKQQNS